MVFPLSFKFKYEQKKTAKEEKLFWCKDRLFLAMHWLTIVFITTASFFTGVPTPNMDAWNMTLYCNEEIFNQPLTPVDTKWVLITIVITASVTVLMLSLRMLIIEPTSKEFLEILNFFLGLLLGWDVTYVLKSLISYPIPSFYNNDLLKQLYCCKSCPDLRITKRLKQLDMESRTSFPSYLICASAYTTVFLFLLTCHLDQGQRIAAKLLSLLVPGLVCVVYSWLLWQNNENHLQDVIAGALLGTLLAAYIMRDLFLNDKKSDRFGENFTSVIMEREIELAEFHSRSNQQGGNRVNEYTINLYPHDEAQVQPLAAVEDRPPPYTSMELPTDTTDTV